MGDGYYRQRDRIEQHEAASTHKRFGGMSMCQLERQAVAWAGTCPIAQHSKTTARTPVSVFACTKSHNTHTRNRNCNGHTHDWTDLERRAGRMAHRSPRRAPAQRS
jgi:hypothetical protein